MKVLKFGGTSVGTVDSLKNLKHIVDSLEEPAVVVVSALGGLTDQLIANANTAASGDRSYLENVAAFSQRHKNIIEAMVPHDKIESVWSIVSDLLKQLEEIYTGISLIKDVPDKILAQIVSFGERMSSVIVANLLEDSVHADSLSFMKTEKWFDKNIADRQLTDSLIKKTFSLPLKQTVVVGGFISRDRDTDEITNLGRGGSDYTAALIAAALEADLLEIWTDVDGFMTADPRIIPDAKVISDMSFIESMELCSYGAKVIYPPTIYPVFHKNIPIKILNTHNPTAPGTLITDKNDSLSQSVRGISSVKNSAIVTINGNLAANVAEINTRTYNAMARNGISIFLVAQPDADVAFSLAMAEKDAPKAVEILKNEFAPELQNGMVKNVSVMECLAIVAIVRESIKELKGLGPRLVYTLQRDQIPVRAISDGTSETTIALVIDNFDVDRSLQLIHNACFAE